jgi:hypothetical protein
VHKNVHGSQKKEGQMKAFIPTLLTVTLILVLAASAQSTDSAQFASSAWWQEMDRDGCGGRP